MHFLIPHSLQSRIPCLNATANHPSVIAKGLSSIFPIPTGGRRKRLCVWPCRACVCTIFSYPVRDCQYGNPFPTKSFRHPGLSGGVHGGCAPSDILLRAQIPTNYSRQGSAWRKSCPAGNGRPMIGHDIHATISKAAKFRTANQYRKEPESRQYLPFVAMTHAANPASRNPAGLKNAAEHNLHK